MHVRFQANKKRLTGLFSSNKNYSLIEADAKLKEFCALPQTKQKNSFIIEIHEGKNRIFRSDFEAGEDQTNNLVLLVESLLEINFPDDSEEEKADLLQKINEALKEERNPTVKIERESESKSKKQKQKTITKQPKNNRGFFLLLKKVKIPLLTLLCVGIIGGAGFIWFNGAISKADQSDSYEMLVKKREYLEAYEQYPEKEVLLVESLFSDKNREGLELLSERGNSNLSEFYLNFLNEEWKEVTSQKKVKLNETVQAMRGYAFLKQNKIEEAEIINQEIDNETLSDQINDQKKLQAYDLLKKKDIEAAEKINEIIKDSELAEDIKVAKSIVNLLNKYQADRENKDLSDKERTEADDNFKLWEENLKQIGGTKDE